MPMEKIYYVYILSSQRRVLYIGITSNIEQRVFQHKTHAFEGFTAQYNATMLVYLERYGAVLTAIRREKEIKGWRREKKLALIESSNPNWNDLSHGLVPGPSLSARPEETRIRTVLGMQSLKKSKLVDLGL
jgi:predicted GIY-YIG superfamily endonuclease